MSTAEPDISPKTICSSSPKHLFDAFNSIHEQRFAVFITNKLNNDITVKSSEEVIEAGITRIYSVKPIRMKFWNTSKYDLE